MPYDPDNPPDKLKNLSYNKKRQWVHVYNSCAEDGGSEEKCHKEAWGTVNKTKSEATKSTEEMIKDAILFHSEDKNLIAGLRKQLKADNEKKRVLGQMEDLLPDSDPMPMSMPMDNPMGEEYMEPTTSDENDVFYSNRSEFEEKVLNIISSDYDELGDHIRIDPSQIRDGRIIVTWDHPNEADLVSHFDSNKAISEILGMFDLEDLNVGISDEKKVEIKDSIIESIESYINSLNLMRGDNRLIVESNEESRKILDFLYDYLESNNLVGESRASEGTEITQMSNKKGSFNLRKYAEKVYDSIREKNILWNDPQYRTRHPKALPEYEEVYIPDAVWKTHIMDKYYPETLGEDGEFHGGYIEDRFVVYKNTEGNSIRLKPGHTQGPDRPESYSTERRLENMRREQGEDRGYKETHGDETEQQNKKVAQKKEQDPILAVYAKRTIDDIKEDHGTFRVKMGSSVFYLDTEEEVEELKKISQLDMAVVRDDFDVERDLINSENDVEDIVEDPKKKI